jgi:hypothetical protein
MGVRVERSVRGVRVDPDAFPEAPVIVSLGPRTICGQHAGEETRLSRPMESLPLPRKLASGRDRVGRRRAHFSGQTNPGGRPGDANPRLGAARPESAAGSTAVTLDVTRRRYSPLVPWPP